MFSGQLIPNFELTTRSDQFEGARTWIFGNISNIRKFKLFFQVSISIDTEEVFRHHLGFKCMHTSMIHQFDRCIDIQVVLMMHINIDR